MWRLFEPISWRDLVFGPDAALVAMHQRLEGLELGIESFWAGLPLAYGLVKSAFVLIGWVLLRVYLVRATRPDSAVVLVLVMMRPQGRAARSRLAVAPDGRVLGSRA